jgi:hypothetical protein
MGSLRKLWAWVSRPKQRPDCVSDKATNDDHIIAQVVLAEILAGNPAATDNLTFDLPDTRSAEEAGE